MTHDLGEYLRARRAATRPEDAGFPSGGRPYGTINIGTGLNTYSVDVNEHVITHELGHAIGFRHSDYYNRAISCGGSAWGSRRPQQSTDAGRILAHRVCERPADAARLPDHVVVSDPESSSG